MAQAMIDIFKKNNLNKTKKVKTQGTQTGDHIEFFANFSKTKSMHLYWSNVFKDYIVCLNFSNNKKYIIRRSEWKILRTFFTKIDHVLNNESHIHASVHMHASGSNTIRQINNNNKNFGE